MRDTAVISACDRLHPEVLELSWTDGGTITLPYLWLRDNCGCDNCRIAQVSEKQFLISTVPATLSPSEATIVDNELRLLWPDGHRTQYKASELRALCQTDAGSWRPWGADFLPRTTEFREFLDDDRVAIATMADFFETGVVVLIDAPTDPGTLERLVPRLGPIREVQFGRIHDVRLDPKGYNVAHTALALPPHNDMASYSWPPSVQALHMLRNSARGGESFIVDGWAVLGELRSDHPEFFDSLCAMPVPFRMFDESAETFATEPLVRCGPDGEIKALRYSNQLMQPIDPTRQGVLEFYRAYHELSRRLNDPSARLTFRLNSGELLLVAGHRVLHGREAYEALGERYLQDAYFELDHMQNHWRVLNRRNASTNG